MLKLIGWSLAIVSGYLFGWIACTNGFPHLWQQAIVMLIGMCGIFGSLILCCGKLNS